MNNNKGCLNIHIDDKADKIILDDKPETDWKHTINELYHVHVLFFVYLYLLKTDTNLGPVNLSFFSLCIALLIGLLQNSD